MKRRVLIELYADLIFFFLVEPFNRTRTYCTWRGPSQLGEPCFYGEPWACFVGECAPDISMEPKCMHYCSNTEDIEGEMSCDNVCTQAPREITTELSVCY